MLSPDYTPLDTTFLHSFLHTHHPFLCHFCSSPEPVWNALSPGLPFRFLVTIRPMVKFDVSSGPQIFKAHIKHCGRPWGYKDEEIIQVLLLRSSSLDEEPDMGRAYPHGNGVPPWLPHRIGRCSARCHGGSGEVGSAWVKVLLKESVWVSCPIRRYS